jgi:hypothetical protein
MSVGELAAGELAGGELAGGELAGGERGTGPGHALELGLNLGTDFGVHAFRIDVGYMYLSNIEHLNWAA